jgi:hypothetical protein
LKSKEYTEHLESLETRIARVTGFLKLFRPTLKQYEVVPLTDVYGPTATDGNIQALVVSQETCSGAEAGMLTFFLFCHDIHLLITFFSCSTEGRAQPSPAEGICDRRHFVVRHAGGNGHQADRGRDEDQNEQHLYQTVVGFSGMKMNMSNTFIRQSIAFRA